MSDRGAPEAAVASRHLRMPHVEPGMTVGLFGGSFDPPHAGHRLVADTALRRIGLDQLWWMVTPQNPLKTGRRSSELACRIALSQEIARHPRIRVTAFEAAHAIRYSADTIALVRRRYPATHFVWIMGADNLRNFHRWERWQWIARSIPIAIVDRPGSSLASLSSVLTRTYSAARIDCADAARLPFARPPAWTYLYGPRRSISSTWIRQQEEMQEAAQLP